MNSSSNTAPVAGRGEPAGESQFCVLSPAVSFTLPNPPSVNAMFRNVVGKGRVKTSAYRDWQMAARVAVRQQQVEGLNGRLIIIIGIERGSDLSDIDNRVKAILDLLTEKHGVGLIEDDRFVTSLLVSWLPKANGLAHVQLLPVQSVTAQFHPALNGASGAWTINAPFNDGEHDGDQPE